MVSRWFCPPGGERRDRNQRLRPHTCMFPVTSVCQCHGRPAPLWPMIHRPGRHVHVPSASAYTRQMAGMAVCGTGKVRPPTVVNVRFGGRIASSDDPSSTWYRSDCALQWYCGGRGSLGGGRWGDVGAGTECTQQHSRSVRTDVMPEASNDGGSGMYASHASASRCAAMRAATVRNDAMYSAMLATWPPIPGRPSGWNSASGTSPHCAGSWVGWCV